MITFSEEYLRRLADIQNEYNLKELVMLPEDEPRFIIDLDTRKIILPDEFKFLAVENDHNAETIYFEIDRYYDKQDLSQKTCIVQYKNTSDAKAIEGFYPVTKLDVDTVPGKILFGWTIENKVTVLPGSVDFSIRFYSINDSGRLPVFTYNINTLTGSLPVIDTLNTSNQGVEVIPGKVESLTAKFEALAKQAESNVLFSDDAAKKAAASAEESKANADAAKASASEAAKNAKKAAASADKSKTQADRAQSEADRAKAEAEEAADRADKAAAAAEGALIAVEETVSKALTDIESGKHTALESITHQKEDALAAVDQSKTDATGDVQTAKQEAVAAITHTGAAQTEAVTRAGEQAVQEVDSAAQAGVGSVEQTKQTATQAVQTAATAAIQRVEQTGSTQVQAVTAAGTGQVKKIEDAAAEKLEGIKEANAHAPQPNPATGKWQVWDTESGQYMDTAVPYQGGYYTPTMAEDGTLTWTGSQPDMPALPSANIRGPQGLGVPNPSQEAAGKVPTVTDAGDGYQLTGPYAPLASALRPTVKGNPAVCEESIAWGFQGLKVYGKSVQDGVPTPENPVPILSAGGGGEISVTVSGGATANQNLTISTPDGLLGIPVKSGGTFIDSSGEQWKSDYRDYAAGSDFQWVGKTIVDGAENKFIADDVYWNLKFSTSPNIEHFPGVLSQYFGQNSFSSNTNYDFLFTSQARMNLYGINTIDELNQLCQKWNTDGDPLTICYTMREPIITPIPPEELAAYRALTTYDGTTVVSTTEPVAGLEVKYVADATNAIIDDTAITSAKTWSSLRILDTLCPPIQATGNPVVCHPIEGYPLGVSVDFAPIQEGAGDPSPENIRPIKARESVDVLRCGVNVLDPHLIEDAVFKPYGLTITHIGGGKVHIEGVFTRATPEGSFVILRTKQHILGGKGLKAHAFVTKGNLKVISAYGFRNVGENVIALLVDWAPGTAIDIEVQIVVTPKDITPIAFTPYTGQTATLTLPTPCYGGEVDAVTGAGRETWHTIVLTGQESSHIFEKFFYLNIENNPKPKDITSGRSSHYKYATYGKGCIGVTKNGVSAVLGAEGQFAIDEAGLNAWKSYLAAQYAAGTPVQITYKLEKPIPITATGGKPIPALAGTNTLLTDGDSLTVTGREDPTHKIQQLRAAVVALGGTI